MYFDSMIFFYVIMVDLFVYEKCVDVLFLFWLKDEFEIVIGCSYDLDVFMFCNL